MEEALKVNIGADIKDLQNGLNAATNSMKQFGNNVKLGANQASNALTNFGRVVQDAPFGIIGITNNINPLLESFQRLKAETGSTKQALSALGSSLLGGGGLGLAVSVATSLLTVLATNGFFKAEKAAEETKKSVDALKSSLEGVIKNAAQEATEVNSLIAVLKSETASREKKNDAIKELQRINPQAFADLKNENGLITGLDAAYQSYIKNLKLVIAAKQVQARLEDVTNKILEKEGGALTKGEQEVLNVGKKINQELKNRAQYGSQIDAINQREQKGAKELNSLYSAQKALFEKLAELQAGIVVPTAKEKEVKQPKEKKVKVKVEAEEDTLQASIQRLLNKYRDTKKIEIPVEVKEPFIQEIFDPAKLDPWFEKIKAIREQFAMMREAAIQTATAVVDVLGGAFQSVFDSIVNGGQNAFQAFGNVIKKLIARLVVAAATAAVLSLIISTIPGFGGAKPGAFNFKSLFAQFGGFQIPGNANGTKNFAGGLSIVGERGPELAYLPTGSGVVPNHDLRSMLGQSGGNITIENNITPSGLATIVRRGERELARSF